MPSRMNAARYTLALAGQHRSDSRTHVAADGGCGGIRLYITCIEIVLLGFASQLFTAMRAFSMPINSSSVFKWAGWQMSSTCSEYFDDETGQCRRRFWRANVPWKQVSNDISTENLFNYFTNQYLPLPRWAPLKICSSAKFHATNTWIQQANPHRLLHLVRYFEWVRSKIRNITTADSQEIKCLQGIVQLLSSQRQSLIIREWYRTWPT